MSTTQPAISRSSCFELVDISELGLDLDEARTRAEKAYSHEGYWYYAEPSYVIAKIGLNRVIQDVDWQDDWVRGNILQRVAISAPAECAVTLYRLPPRGGVSPIHVDIETCNILIPLHETQGLAIVKWFEWPKLSRALTAEDWRLYGEDWDRYPICDFPDDLEEMARHTWRRGEAVLLNTRQPHCSVNYSEIARINLVINFYGISFAEVSSLIRERKLFKASE